jgi:hypothetical protein
MQFLQKRSKEFSDAENREACSSYRETSRAIEKEFSRGTWARYTKPVNRSSGRAGVPELCQNQGVILA